MESDQSSSLADSLLQWVRSFDFDAAKTADWKGLADGATLWAILQQLDDAYFAGELPEPNVGKDGDWTRKWQNLRHVEKQIATYYRDICNGQDHATSTSAPWAPDLQAIAAEDSLEDLQKLIMMIIRAAMASPESNQRMAQRLMSLGRENAMAIATELRNMEEADYDEPEPTSRAETPDMPEMSFEQTTPKANGGRLIGGAVYGDPLLEREEELLQAQVTIDKLQAQHADAQTQLQELKQQKERLQEAFDVYRSEIDTRGKRSTAPSNDDSIKKLQRQAENDRAYIDNLEQQLTANRDTIDKFERQVERQKAEGEAAQKLRDDLQALKAENEDLQQKIKANENLKKKIQTLQEQERANTTLREELRTANEKLEDLDKLRQLQASLEKEIIEKKGLIRNQEYQINELLTTRKHIEYEARLLEKKLEAARERHDRDHETLVELRGRLNESSIDDNPDDSLTETTPTKSGADAPVTPAFVPKNDESKNLAEKLALVEKQLEAADARLKQAAQRNASLEEETRTQAANLARQSEMEDKLSASETTVAALRRELDHATAQQPAAPPQDVAALQKENHLLSTAWYDLASRLQHSNVTLSRRKPEPKSWIAQQRAAVGPRSGSHHRPR